ncbi:MAG: helix-turn-helix domain-containing protein [Nitrospirae bacterium]|nr:helix-turn-helix domain-containing protein [Nitrospirota bacterium]
MKSTLEPEDIKAIATAVKEELRAILHNHDKHLPENVIFDVAGLCEYLKVTPEWVYAQTHSKSIPYIKKGNLLRFRKRDIDKHLDQHKMPAIVPSSGYLKIIK